MGPRRDHVGRPFDQDHVRRGVTPGVRYQSQPGATDREHLRSVRGPRLIAEDASELAIPVADGNGQPSAGVNSKPKVTHDPKTPAALDGETRQKRRSMRERRLPPADVMF